MRNKILGALVGAALCTAAASANASLIFDNITYSIESEVINATTDRFALVISGENVGLDAGSGRTGINAISFNNPAGNNAVTTGAVVATLFNNVVVTGTNGYTFSTGGLSAAGCNGTGSFFCYDNGNIPPIPTTNLTGKIVIAFDATAAAGFPANFNPSFKIEWVGTKTNLSNNVIVNGGYSLVSMPVGVDSSACPDCSPTPFVATPEPLSLAVLGVGLFGLGLARRRAA